MTVFYTRTYTTACPGDLRDAINADVAIAPVCQQVVYDGATTTYFEFNVALSAGEEAALDSLLAGFTCPAALDPPIDDQGDIWVDEAGDTMTGDLIMDTGSRILLPDGSQSNPSLTFANDQGDGMFHNGNWIEFTIGGFTKMELQSSEADFKVPVRTQAGSAASPAFSFEFFSNLGTYASPDGTELRFVSGGADRAHIGPTALELQPSVNLRFTESGGGTDTIDLAAPAAITSPYTLTLPTDTGNAGQVLTTDGAGVLTWSEAAGANMVGVQARRTTPYSMASTFTAVPFDTTDVEVDAGVVSHDPIGNPTRITVNETGLYLIAYSITDVDYNSTNQSTRARTSARVTLNGVAAALPGSYAVTGNRFSFSDGDSERDDVSKTFIVSLTAGDYIELQAQGTADAVGTLNFTAISESVSFSAVRLEGVKGEQGIPGSGSSITIEDDNVAVPNTPHTILNFGSGISVTDDGGGQATISLPSLSDLAATSVRRITTEHPITPTAAPIPFNTVDVATDTSVVEQTSSTEITVKETGLYLILVDLFVGVGSNDDTVTIELRKNNVGIPGATTSVRIADAATVAAITPSNFFELAAGDTVSLWANVAPAEPNGSVKINSQFAVGRYGGIVGPAGQDGLDGAPGSGSTLIVKDEGVNVANTPHSAFNFVGGGVSVTDGGAGVANIAVEAGMRQQVVAAIGTGSTSATHDQNLAPTIATGTQIATLTVTPTSASNSVELKWMIFGDISADRTFQVFIFRGSTFIGFDTVAGWKRGGYFGTGSGSIVDSPNTTSPVTYSIRVACSPSGTVYWGQNADGQTLGGTLASKQYFSATEINIG